MEKGTSVQYRQWNKSWTVDNGKWNNCTVETWNKNFTLLKRQLTKCCTTMKVMYGSDNGTSGEHCTVETIKVVFRLKLKERSKCKAVITDLSLYSREN